MNDSNIFSCQFESVSPSIASDDPIFSGKGRLTIQINHWVLWGEQSEQEIHGFDEYWDNLLLHLARILPYLWTEQSYPLGYFPESPDRFVDKALSERRWGDFSDEKIMKDEKEILAFSKRHNLAEGMPSVHLPYIYFMREGNDMRIVSETADIHIPLNRAMEELTRLGKAIAQSVSGQSLRGRKILSEWNNFNKGLASDTIISLNTGLPIERLRVLAENDNLENYFGSASLEQPEPLQIAARMTRFTLLAQEQKQVLQTVQRMSMTPLTDSFMHLRDQAEKELTNLNDIKAYDQGYRLAQWLRDKLKIGENGSVDPEKLLGAWGISISKMIVSESVDAIARWEEKQAGILVNTQGLRAQLPWGRRSTLAHELAHLLVDTRHAMPAVEVLSRRTDALWEKRANAFTAEFLLPVSQVVSEMPQIIRPETIKTVLERLSERFEVGHIIVARQIQNQLNRTSSLDSDTSMYLERVGERHGGQELNHWLRA